MLVTCCDGDHIASTQHLFHTVHNCLALAGNNRPNFLTVVMHMVSHMLASSHGNLDCHRTRLNIDYCISTPRFLSIHRFCLDFFHIGLHITTTFFISNQDTIATGRNDHILAAHAEDGDIQLIHNIGVLAGFVENGFTLGLICHDLGHHVPSADILPVAAVTQNLNAGLFLDHGIVKANLS